MEGYIVTENDAENFSLLQLVRQMHTAISLHIQQRDFSEAIAMLRSLNSGLSHDNRQDLEAIEQISEGLIFDAIDANEPGLIEVLIKECDVDIEESLDLSLFTSLATDSHVAYTPLAYAAKENHLEAFKTLVSLGAKVNVAMVSTGHTILHLACMEGNLEIVRVLFENGVDSAVVDNEGNTPLMAAAFKRATSVCRFLIERGAEINATDISGNTALHNAAFWNDVETVQLLLEHGADLFIENKYGEDSLQVASMNCSAEVADALRQTSVTPVIRRIQSHQLMGAFFLHDQGDVSKAYAEWESAINLRNQSPWLVEENQFDFTKNPAYGGVEEAMSLSKLNQISQNRTMILMQALLLTEKILGPTHIRTVQSTVSLGFKCIENEDFSRGLHLLRHGFNLCRANWLRYFDRDIYIDFTRRFSYYSRIRKCLSTRLCFQDLYDFLETVAAEAKSICSVGRTQSNEDEVKCLIHITLYLIRLFCHLKADQVQTFQFKKLVYSIAQLKPRSSKGRTLLMNAVSIQCVEIKHKVLFRTSDVVKLLLECGVDADDQDNDGNTVLHLLESSSCKRMSETSRAELRDVTEILLSDNGAHFDAKNNAGADAMKYLESQRLDLSKHLSLQCLAARTIRRFGISYKGLPKHLIHFVKMH